MDGTYIQGFRRLTVKVSWYRKVGGKGRRGISFPWRQHWFFFKNFSILALSYDKLEGTGRGGVGEGGEGGGGGGVRARGWDEAHRVRFTPAFAAVLSSGPLPMERTRNVPLDVLCSHERLTRLLLSILSRGGAFHFRERSCGTN